MKTTETIKQIHALYKDAVARELPRRSPHYNHNNGLPLTAWLFMAGNRDSKINAVTAEKFFPVYRITGREAVERICRRIAARREMHEIAYLATLKFVSEFYACRLPEYPTSPSFVLSADPHLTKYKTKQQVIDAIGPIHWAPLGFLINQRFSDLLLQLDLENAVSYSRNPLKFKRSMTV